MQDDLTSKSRLVIDMSKQTKQVKTNAHGVTAPVRARKTNSTRDPNKQLQRLAKKHSVALSYLANR
jgi:hypothetical protein